MSKYLYVNIIFKNGNEKKFKLTDSDINLKINRGGYLIFIGYDDEDNIWLYEFSKDSIAGFGLSS